MLRAPRKKTAKTKTLTRKEAYDKANTKGLYIKLNKKTDADIIDFLETVGNKQGLVKSLIRESDDYKDHRAIKAIMAQL